MHSICSVQPKYILKLSGHKWNEMQAAQAEDNSVSEEKMAIALKQLSFSKLTAAFLDNITF